MAVLEGPSRCESPRTRLTGGRLKALDAETPLPEGVKSRSLLHRLRFTATRCALAEPRTLTACPEVHGSLTPKRSAAVGASSSSSSRTGITQGNLCLHPGMDRGECQVLLGSHCVFVIGPMKFVIDFLIDHWRGFRDLFVSIWVSIRDRFRDMFGGITAVDSDDHRCHPGRYRLGKAAINWFKRWLGDTSTCSRSTVPRIVKRSVEYRHRDSQ
jgi:hypothetical protein